MQTEQAQPSQQDASPLRPLYPPVHILTPKQFADLLERENMRAALEAYARSRVGQDAEDVVGDVIGAALHSLHQFDFATGVGGMSAWLFGILRRRLSFVRRRRMVEVEALGAAASVRWSQLNGHKERAVLEDVELVAEARARLRYAPLTELQMLCISARIDGEGVKQTAAALGISEASVRAHNRAALKKIKAVPGELALEPDMDFYVFRLCSRVTVYRAPMRTGSGVAKEALKRLT